MSALAASALAENAAKSLPDTTPIQMVALFRDLRVMGPTLWM
jgi:hypothetical protein